ncbi:MAG: NTP transferase domain-containing protein [Desulfovibrio sp.]|nr:NTP transferase domain-containing protein [Desulfovibrio sp.]
MFAAVILAAGQGQRMGSVAKALLPVPQESALATLALTFRLCGVERILVVSGWYAEQVEGEARRLGLALVKNARPELGMFSSVLTGLKALSRLWPELSGVFVQPVDCPLVRALTMDHLLAVRRDRVAIPSFAGQSGHPPLLPASLLPQLLSLPPDQPGGLQSVLWPWDDVPVCDSSMLLDMDSPEDYARIKAVQPWLEALYPHEAEELLRLMSFSPKAFAHARAVGSVAKALAKKAGCQPWLALSGGLLHDLAKGRPDHEAVGAKWLYELHLPLMAKLVADHRDLIVPDGEAITERELVYLADKYCFGSQFVSIAQRFGQKIALFAHDRLACAAIEKRMQHALGLEERLRREFGQAPALIARQALRKSTRLLSDVDS